MESTAYIKYVFLDIVRYSHNRTVEAQTDIIGTLNKIVEESIKAFPIDESIIFLPTGDGICICLINILDPYDIHMQISLSILEKLFKYNSETVDKKRQFQIRIGINENDDNLIIDINKNKNIAGAGINFAQRIMDCADYNQIMVGENVFSKLNQREKYSDSFIPLTKNIKHNIELRVYRYINENIDSLNNYVAEEKNIKLRLSKFIKNYISIIEIFKDKIKELAGHDTNSYSLFILFCWITNDVIDYKNSTEISRRNGYNEKLYLQKESFIEYFERVANSDHELIFSTHSYYSQQYSFNKYPEYFEDTDLTLKNASDTQLKNLPDLIKENRDILLKQHPGLFE